MAGRSIEINECHGKYCSVTFSSDSVTTKLKPRSRTPSPCIPLHPHTSTSHNPVSTLTDHSTSEIRMISGLQTLITRRVHADIKFLHKIINSKINCPSLFSQTVDLNKSFQTDKLHLVLGGVYPLKKIRHKWLYKLSAIFNYAISWTQLLLMLTFSFTQLSNLVKLSEALLFNSTQIAFVCKLLNFDLQKRKMLELEDFLQKPTLTSVTDEEEIIIRDHIKGVRRIGLIFRVLCVGVVIFYALFPLLDKNSDGSKKLPLPMWFPFDSRNYYHVIWFSEILSIAIGAWINSNIDILSYTLMTLGTAQFEILKNRLRNVVKITNNTVDEDVVLNELKRCIVHFNDINSLIVLIETTLSKGIFVQFLCSVLFICMTGFQILIISFRSMQFVLLLTYFSCLTCQVAMYCWYGHVLMNSSDKISEACYMSDWFSCSPKIQKMFVIIMERAKRPAKLKAANFFFLNLQTLMAILKTSYSYFAVLWHIYSNDLH